MRKVLLALLALGGAVAAVPGAHAAPALGPMQLVDEAPQVEAVQYYNDWRYRQHLRRERFEHRQRHREFRHWQRQHRPYGYGPPGHYRQYGYYGPRW